ncbi:MAG: M28 family peptidase, partial [Campylobacterales bacterium]
MEATLKYLTSIQPPRNYKNLDSLNRVAEYLKSRFEGFGLQTEYMPYMIEQREYKNIIATINPNAKHRLVMGAHYDVYGEFQGADDNASAVAGLVQSAKLLSCEDISIRIDFVAFSTEEPPYFLNGNMGSQRHAKMLKEQGVELIGVINYEMIGYFSDEPNSQNYPYPLMEMIYPNTGNFIAAVANESSKEFLEELGLKNAYKKIGYESMLLPDDVAHIAASDQISYWEQGYKGVMISDTAHFRNPNYHTKNDTIDTLDIEKMGFVVELVVE